MPSEYHEIRINTVASITYCSVGPIHGVTYENTRMHVRVTETGSTFYEALCRLYRWHHNFPKAHEAFMRKEMRRLS